MGGLDIPTSRKLRVPTFDGHIRLGDSDRNVLVFAGLLIATIFGGVHCITWFFCLSHISGTGPMVHECRRHNLHALAWILSGVTLIPGCGVPREHVCNGCYNSWYVVHYSTCPPLGTYGHHFTQSSS
ncbi:hypothetical protein DFH29DRAFT_886153, partial [Suillus ampliporus]